MSTSESSISDLIGRDFGPYRFVRRLGVGGMAETYEVIRRGPRGFTQRVCLKLVLPFFAEDEGFIELFHREARLAATLRHSNIVGVIDFGEVDGRSYMALELVDGPDLRSLLDHQQLKRLAPDYVALLGLELARALEHAHQPRPASSVDDPQGSTRGIVHRDLSPSNVLISRQGEILLTDFGVAKAMSGASRQQSAVKGKVPYMSPEQLRAERLDGRADLFALGVVLFEALAGERPYEGAHDPATIMLILEGDRPRLASLAPDAPPGLCEVIDSLLEPDREKRPDNAAALIELLDEYAPSPRTRRRLGEMAAAIQHEAAQAAADISEIVGTEPTEEHPEPGAEDTGIKRAGSRAAELSPEVDGAAEQESVASADPPPPVEQASRWSRRDLAKIAAGAVLSLGGAGAGALAWWRFANDDGAALEPVDPIAEPKVLVANPEGSGTPEAEKAAAAPLPAQAPPEQDAAAPATDTGGSEPAVQAPEPARLTVIVFPWGNVWINGKPRGAAPLRGKSLPPGRYKVGVGRQSPSKSRTVRLRAGERRTLQFDLTQ